MRRTTVKLLEKIRFKEAMEATKKYVITRREEVQQRKPCKVTIRIGRGTPWRILIDMDVMTEVIGIWDGLWVVRCWSRQDQMEQVMELDGTGSKEGVAF